MTSYPSTAVIGIDCQFDFTDEPGAALPVPGGARAMRTFAYMIGSAATKLKGPKELILTRDWHPKNHFVSAGAQRIVDHSGTPVTPYTQMTQEEVREGKYHAADPRDEDWLWETATRLRAAGGKDIMVWPEHCVADTPGAEFHETIQTAIEIWLRDTGKPIYEHKKGLDSEREQYGAFGDEIVGRDGSFIPFDKEPVELILSQDRKWWGGLALSHCLMASFDQVMQYEDPAMYSSHTILRDCTAAVPGFEKMAEEWLKRWQQKGVNVSTSADVLAA